MEFTGRFKKGRVEFDEPITLPEGTPVTISLQDLPEERKDGMESPDARAPAETSTLYDRLKHVIGTVKDLPPDFARNHDHYIHGSARKFQSP